MKRVLPLAFGLGLTVPIPAYAQINQLPSATMPLTGNELIAIDQPQGTNFKTVKTPISSFSGCGIGGSVNRLIKFGSTTAACTNSNIVDDGTSITATLASTGHFLILVPGAFSGASNQDIAQVFDNRTGQMTLGGAAIGGYSRPDQTAEDILRRVSSSPNYPQYDAVRGVAVMANGSTGVVNTGGVAGYVRNQTPGGVSHNGVALFGVVTCEVDESACWGLNPIVMDSSQYGLQDAHGPRYLAGAEWDFNVMNTTTQAIGMIFTGSSIAQPFNAIAIGCNSLEQNPTPKPYPIHWNTCLISQDGASLNALAVGARSQAQVANSGSQTITFSYWDASLVRQSYLMEVSSGPLPTSLVLHSADGALPASFGTTGNFYQSVGTGIYYGGQEALGVDNLHNLYVAPDPLITTIWIGNASSKIILNGLPTSAPSTTGALWRDASAGNVVKIVP